MWHNSPLTPEVSAASRLSQSHAQLLVNRLCLSFSLWGWIFIIGNRGSSSTHASCPRFCSSGSSPPTRIVRQRAQIFKLTWLTGWGVERRSVNDLSRWLKTALMKQIAFFSKTTFIRGLCTIKKTKNKHYDRGWRCFSLRLRSSHQRFVKRCVSSSGDVHDGRH